METSNVVMKPELRRRWHLWWLAPFVCLAAMGQPAPATASEVYFSDYGTNTIQRVNDDGSGLVTVLSGISGVRGVQVDTVHRKLYWAEADSHSLRRANLDGSSVEDVVVQTSGVPYELALDGGGRLYWTDEVNGAIRRANLDGSGLEDLITAGLSRPVGIALDVAAGKMYWADYDLGTISRANLDGTARETLVTGLSYPNHLVVDADSGQLYFTHGLFTPSYVSRTTLDGAGLVTIVSGESSAAGLALDATSGMLFWTAEDGFAVRRATTAGATVATVVGGLSRPLGVAVMPAAEPDDGLVSWWRADGVAGDSAGSNHGSLVGGAGYVAGVSGQAFWFDGNSGSMHVPQAASLDTGGLLTVAFWMRADEDNPMDMSRGQGLVTSDHWGIEISPGMDQRTGANLFVAASGRGGFTHTSDANGGSAPLRPGSWYHVAGTYDGFALRLFINGHPWGNPMPLTGSIYPMGGFLSIGSEDGRSGCPGCVGTRNFKGAIDEVRVYDRALLPAEVAGLAAVLGNQAPVAYPGSITAEEQRPAAGTLTGLDPEHAPLTFAVTSPPAHGTLSITNPGTGAFTYTSHPGYTGADSFAFVASDDERASAPALVSITVAAAPPGGPPRSGLVSWWRGEGDASDGFGFNHGAASGGVSYTAGVDGQAFMFDGIDGSVNVPSSPSLDVGAQVTIALWMRDDDLTPGRFDGVGLVTTDHWGVVQAVPVSTEMFAFLDRYAETNESNDWNALPPGRWYHVVATYDGAAMQMYVNGQPWGAPSPAGGPLYPMVGFLSIGSEEGRVICPSCVNTRYFQGAIDEVMIYNRALSPGEIADLASSVGNQAPLAYATSVTTLEYRSFSGVLSGSDPEYAPLSYTVSSPPRMGTVTVTDASAGAFTYTPSPGVTGTDTFAFVASDGDRASAPALISITIEPADPLVTVRLVDSGGNGLAGGVVTYYRGGWQSFGMTDQAGNAELTLPAGSYTFAMKYAGGRIQKAQDVGADPVVVFQTRDVTVQLRDSAGSPLDAGTAEYYASGWKPFGTTAGGEVHKELLPASYTFAMKYAGGRIQKAHDIAADPVVVFQTGAVVSDSGTCTQYYASGWKVFTQGMQLLSASYTFRFASGSPAQEAFTIAAATENHIR